MKNKITSKEIVEEIKEAISMFGSYTYGDKGPQEVMDIDSIVDRLKELPVEDIITVLTEVRQRSGDAEPFLTVVAYSLQEWDDPRTDILFESDVFDGCY